MLKEEREIPGRMSGGGVVESAWEIVQAGSQLFPDLAHSGQFAFVFLEKEKIWILSCKINYIYNILIF